MISSVAPDIRHVRETGMLHLELHLYSDFKFDTDSRHTDFVNEFCLNDICVNKFIYPIHRCTI